MALMPWFNLTIPDEGNEVFRPVSYSSANFIVGWAFTFAAHVPKGLGMKSEHFSSLSIFKAAGHCVVHERILLVKTR